MGYPNEKHNEEDIFHFHTMLHINTISEGPVFFYMTIFWKHANCEDTISVLSKYALYFEQNMWNLLYNIIQCPERTTYLKNAFNRTYKSKTLPYNDQTTTITKTNFSICQYKREGTLHITAKTPASSSHHLTALFVQHVPCHVQPLEDAFVYDVKNNCLSWQML